MSENPEYVAFRDKMQKDNLNIITMWDCENGYVVFIRRLMFHYSLVLNVLGNEEWSEDHWCYSSDVLDVTNAALKWSARNWEGEPIGWTRNPKTGRRRKDGDLNQEYIAQ